MRTLKKCFSTVLACTTAATAEMLALCKEHDIKPNEEVYLKCTIRWGRRRVSVTPFWEGSKPLLPVRLRIDEAEAARVLGAFVYPPTRRRPRRRIKESI